MNAEEIFSKINGHMIEGIMYHDQMAQYYDFLDLHGYKRQHEYHMLCETVARRALLRYYINHFNRLLPEISVVDPEAIPNGWRGYKRQDVDAGTKKRAIREGHAGWRDWEYATKRMYEQSYKDLCDIGEIAAARKVCQLVEDVDMELKSVDREQIELASIDYDLPSIYLCQGEIHEKYDSKAKAIGVDIC